MRSEKKIYSELLDNYRERLDQIKEEFNKQSKRAERKKIFRTTNKGLKKSIIHVKEEKEEAEAVSKELSIDLSKIKEQENEKNKELLRAQEELKVFERFSDEKEQEIQNDALERAIGKRL
jgi:phosphoribosylanthranilate isomerase